MRAVPLTYHNVKGAKDGLPQRVGGIELVPVGRDFVPHFLWHSRGQGQVKGSNVTPFSVKERLKVDFYRVDLHICGNGGGVILPCVTLCYIYVL